MKFLVFRTSERFNEQFESIEIDSFDELIGFFRENCSVVVHAPNKEYEQFRLEIYDDYRE